jgi:hypothetical protein
VLAGGCFMQPLVLHADNGSPLFCMQEHALPGNA